jgi:hypothetical protein
MILSRKNMHVVSEGWSQPGDQPWYKIMVYTPQLHLQSPPLHTSEYAEELLDMIDKEGKECPHCKKKLY